VTVEEERKLQAVIYFRVIPSLVVVLEENLGSYAKLTEIQLINNQQGEINDCLKANI